MALDDLDRAILQALIDDGALSARRVASMVGSTTPTVSARMKRLEDLGLLRGSTADVAFPQFGNLVAIDAPGTRVQDLSARAEVFSLYRTAGNRLHGLAIFGTSRELDRFRRAYPDVETNVLVREEYRSRPRLPPGTGNVACHECGKLVEEPIRMRLSGHAYVVCCPTCEAALRGRHKKLTKA